MEKFLFFNTAANDSLCMPARRLTDMGMESNGTSLILHFIAAFGGNDGVGEILVDVTITDNKGRPVMEAIAEEIRLGKNPFITVCDDTTSEFLHSDIVSVGSITDFA
tara:strand:- start:2418 stop:2738 length:321 start_codon:yes stop_codon:yes gene_type:complete